MHRQDECSVPSRVSSAFALVTRTNSQCFGPDKIYFPWLRTSRAERRLIVAAPNAQFRSDLSCERSSESRLSTKLRSNSDRLLSSNR